MGNRRLIVSAWALALATAAVLTLYPGTSNALCTHPAQTEADPINFPCDGSGGQSANGVSFGGEVPPAGSEPNIPCEEQDPPKLTSPDPDFDLAGAVDRAIAELTAEGEDLTDANCGKIVERAVQYIPGAGLLYKDYGHQYNNHSVDFIVMPDGRAWDAVIGCGDPNQRGGVGNSGCCAELPATTCEPSDRYVAWP